MQNYNKITSLSEIDLSEDTISIKDEYLSNLVSAPKKLSGSLILTRNKVELSLKGCPQIIEKDLNLTRTILEEDWTKYLPKKIGEHLILDYSNIKNFKGIHKYLKSCKYISANYCESLSSHILGLILIKNVYNINIKGNRYIPNEVVDILNSYLFSKDILECQEQLIDLGFKELAKL